MKLGDEVRTAVPLPGIPAGTLGTIKEIGRLFLVVAFEDGRVGYYARRQLEPALSCQASQRSLGQPLVTLGLSNAHIPRGSHGCLFPCDENTAINTVARYMSAGLAVGETVLCCLPDKWQDYFLRCLRQLGQDGETALRRRQLRMLNPAKLYLPARDFTASKQLERTTMAVSALAKESPQGMRCFGYTGRRFTMTGWWEYEERFTPIARALGATALCGYADFGARVDPWRLAAETHTYLIRDGLLAAGGQAFTG
jgi:hypothetical protein